MTNVAILFRGVTFSFLFSELDHVRRYFCTLWLDVTYEPFLNKNYILDNCVKSQYDN